MKRPVVVWDLPTRAFHWCIVVLVAAEYVTWRVNWMDWHALAGYALFALLLFRVAWGFVGSETARFGRFLASPRAAAHHLARLFRREPDEQIGHNPAGGWMVMLLLALLLGQVLTGILVNNDVADQGPLSDAMPPWLSNRLTDMHDWLWYVLLAAVALHVLAIGMYAAVKRQNLLRPMVTGRKYLPSARNAPRLAPLPLVLPLLALSAAAVALVAEFL